MSDSHEPEIHWIDAGDSTHSTEPAGEPAQPLPSLPPPPDAAMPTTGLPLYAPPPPPTAVRKSPVAVVGVLVGVMALMAATVFAVSALDQPDGSSSPKAAVNHLLGAISHRDALGVIESLPANERDVLRDPLVDIVHQLQRLGILSSFDLNQVPGARITFSDVQLRTTTLGPGVVSVEVVGGKVTGETVPKELPVGDELRKAIEKGGGSLPTTSSSSTSDLADAHLKLVTVKDGGGWHVSIGYSIAEAIRGGHGNPPDYAAAPLPVGADSPDHAVSDLVTAAEHERWSQVVSLLDPQEDKALYAYASLFINDASNDSSQDTLSISDLRMSDSGSGSTVRVKIEGFKVSWGDASGTDVSTSITWDGKCVTTQNTYPPDYFSFGGTTSDYPGLTAKQRQELQQEQQRIQQQEQQQIARDEAPHKTCQGDQPSQDSLGLGAVGALGSATDNFAITVVQRDGRWYVSPVRTLLDTIDSALQHLSRSQLDKILNWWDDEANSSSGEFGSSGSGSGTVYPGNCTGVSDPSGTTSSCCPKDVIAGSPDTCTFVPVGNAIDGSGYSTSTSLGSSVTPGDGTTPSSISVPDPSSPGSTIIVTVPTVPTEPTSTTSTTTASSSGG
jgi:hypothetical protein